MGIIAWFRQHVFSYDPEPIEYQTIAMSLLSGIWVAWPIHRKVIEDSAAYMSLTHHLPPAYWGAFWILVASLKIYGIIHRASVIRKIGSFLGAILWIIASYVILSSAVPGPAIIVFPIIAVSQAWVFIRLGVGVVLEPSNSLSKEA